MSDQRDVVDESDVLTLTETAERLRIHYQTAYKLARRGKLPGLLPNLGSHYRISRAALDRYLNGETDDAA